MKNEAKRPLSKSELKLLERKKKERVKEKKRLEKERRSIEKQKIKEEEKKVKEEIKQMKSDLKNRQGKSRQNKEVNYNTEEEPDYEELKRFYKENKTKSILDANEKSSSREIHVSEFFDNEATTEKITKEKAGQNSSRNPNKKGHSEKQQKPDAKDSVTKKKSPKKSKQQKPDGKVPVTKKKSPKKSSSRSTTKSKDKSHSKNKSPKKVKIKTKKEITNNEKTVPKKRARKIKVNYAMLDKSPPNIGAFYRGRRKKTRHCLPIVDDNIKRSDNFQIKNTKEANLGNMVPENSKVQTNHANQAANPSQLSKQKKFMIKSERRGFIQWDRKYSSEKLICSESLRTLDSMIL